MTPSASDHAALMASVLARPADDAPRLVIADWYREQGLDELADFVGWQVANPKHATMVWDDGHVAGPDSHREWFRGHAAEVVRWHPEWQWVWRQGFVDQIGRMDGDFAVLDLRELLKVWPIRRVTVTSWPSADVMRMLQEAMGRGVWNIGIEDRLRRLHRGVRIDVKVAGAAVVDMDALTEGANNLANGLRRYGRRGAAARR